MKKNGKSGLGKCEMCEESPIGKTCWMDVDIKCKACSLPLATNGSLVWCVMDDCELGRFVLKRED